MSKLSDMRAAAAAKLAAAKAAAQAPAKRDNSHKPRIQVYAGGVITELAIKLALGIETAAQKLARWTESRAVQHVEGGLCPHCEGTGRYRLHTNPNSNDKCYRCHGKGRLDSRDLAFLDRRIKGAGPVCWITSALA
jgi:excinuclease UvrABC ATPase subunit